MVTQVVQPPQPVANCFQLLKLLGGTIKRPHVYSLRERGELLILYSVGIPYPSLIPRASCTFPVHYRKPLFPWDAHLPICHLVCTSLEGVLTRQGAGRIQTTVCSKALEGSGDLSTWLLLYVLFIIQKYHAVPEINVLVYAYMYENICYTSIHYDLFNVLYESHWHLE